MELSLTLFKETTGELTDVVRTIVIGNLSRFKGTLFPVTFIFDSIVTCEFSLSMEVVVTESSKI